MYGVVVRTGYGIQQLISKNRCLSNPLTTKRVMHFIIRSKRLNLWLQERINRLLNRSGGNRTVDLSYEMNVFIKIAIQAMDMQSIIIVHQSYLDRGVPKVFNERFKPGRGISTSRDQVFPRFNVK